MEPKAESGFRSIVAVLPEGVLFNRTFQEAIAPAATHAGIPITRLETEFSHESSRLKIQHAISAADLFIADITGKNPNVLYHLGYAHGLGRPVLLLSHHLEDLPFDRDEHQVIGYSGDHKFLKEELSSFLLQGKVSSRQDDLASSGAREQFLARFGDILKQHQYDYRGEVQLENPTTFVLLNQELDLPLVQALARRAREQGVRLKLM